MKRLRRALEVLAWAAFFALAVALLALRYWLLPEVGRYRPEIVARASAAVGHAVTIGAIEAGWQGLRPHISLSDVRILDAQGREALVLPQVENILSWRSLARGELQVHSLVIHAPRLAVRRDAEGALYVAGMKLAAGGEGGFGAWLLAQHEIEVRNAEIEWRDESRGAPPLALSAVNLRLQNNAGRRLVGLKARVPAGLGQSVELRAELPVRVAEDGWSGKVYAELGYTDLAAWRAWLDYPLDVQAGQGAVRLWASVEGGALREATADLAASGLRVKLGEELLPLELASIRGRLRARIAQDGYQITGRRIALAPERGPALPPIDFQAAWRPDGNGGSASANVLEIEPLLQFVGALPLPTDLRLLAADLEPRGQLADARFDWQGPLAEPTRFSARGRFADLALKPWGAMPGFAGLAGTLEASESRGRVYLQAREAALELPRVFPEPRIAFDALAAQLEWQRVGGALDVRLVSASFANADFGGSAFGSYSRVGSGPGRIDLSANLTRADARALPRYLPLGAIMGEKPRAWLVSSIVGGQASDVHLRLQGDLRRFPFADPQEGQFQVRAHVRQGVLQYADDWPRIHDVEGDLLFERDRMEIVGRSGSILGARLGGVLVSIPRIGPGETSVRVTGHAEGPTAEFLKFIDESPLRSRTGGFTHDIQAAGSGRLTLKLELPLAQLAASRVSGEYEFRDNRVALHRAVPPLERASGRLEFTESGFAVREARGRMLGGAVAVSGGTRAAGAMEFVARGEAPVAAALRTWFDHPAGRSVTGAAPYVATVTIRGGRPRVVVESQLRGVASNLPAPLDKAAADALPLRVEVVPAESGARVSLALGRILAMQSERRRIGVVLSPSVRQSVRLPDREGLLIYGSVDTLDGDGWRRVVADAAAAGGDGLPTALELRARQVDLFGKRIANVSLRAAADSAGWQATVDADQIAGELAFRFGGAGFLQARLLHFTVPQDAPGAKAAPARPGELPSVDLVSERFEVRGKQLGRVEFAAQREGEDWRIDKVLMSNPDAKLRASGTWRGGANPVSELKIALDAADAGNLLARVGHPGVVSGGRAQLSGSVSWDGEPSTLDIPSLTGQLKLTATDGQFVEIEPGLGKLVSLMNLQALPRRVTLDFRDVFSKGFRFDRIDAASQIDRGMLEIRDFRMRGSAAAVAISGSADMVHETQDLRVRVVPSLGDGASTAVAIVNPVAGVAAAIAQRLLKNPLGQIFAYEYDVSGSWSDPKVVKVVAAPVAPLPSEGMTP